MMESIFLTSQKLNVFIKIKNILLSTACTLLTERAFKTHTFGEILSNKIEKKFQKSLYSEHLPNHCESSRSSIYENIYVAQLELFKTIKLT